VIASKCDWPKRDIHPLYDAPKTAPHNIPLAAPAISAILIQTPTINLFPFPRAAATRLVIPSVRNPKIKKAKPIMVLHTPLAAKLSLPKWPTEEISSKIGQNADWTGRRRQQDKPANAVMTVSDPSWNIMEINIPAPTKRRFRRVSSPSGDSLASRRCAWFADSGSCSRFCETLCLRDMPSNDGRAIALVDAAHLVGSGPQERGDTTYTDSVSNRGFIFSRGLNQKIKEEMIGRRREGSPCNTHKRGKARETPEARKHERMRK
jgi:hypothetical protein